MPLAAEMSAMLSLLVSSSRSLPSGLEKLQGRQIRVGFVVYLKRLERGRFQMPVVDEKRRCVDMEGTQLAMLLDGIDLNAQRLPRWRPSIEMGIDGDPRS